MRLQMWPISLTLVLLLREVRIPVKVATQSMGKRPPKPVKVATSSERSDARSLFLLYLVSCRQMSLFFRSDSPSNFIL